PPVHSVQATSSTSSLDPDQDTVVSASTSHLASHCVASTSSNSQTLDPPSVISQTVSQQSNPVQCSVCGRRFENERALSSHFSSHPIEANMARLRPCHIPSQPTASSSEPISSSDIGSLTSECSQWYHKFTAILNDFGSFQFADFDKTYS